MSEHKQPEYEKEETMKKNQIRKSVAALAMAVVGGGGAKLPAPYLLAYTSTKSRLTLSPLPIRARNTRIPINLSR